MVFTCYLCEKESVILTRFCEPCNELRRILSIYGAEECRDILKRVCIRGVEQREYKIKKELKDNKDITGDYPKNNLSDESYIKTRSKSK
tara:strand:- start:20353 stop:20619 length:267 start_codon:yes stop_codon:yes gene_type:complete